MGRRSLERVPARPLARLIEGRVVTDLAQRMADRYDPGDARAAARWERWLCRVASGSVRTVKIDLADKLCSALGEWPGALFPELWGLDLGDVEIVVAN